METKAVALGLLPGLVKVAKLSTNLEHEKISKQIFAFLWEVFVNEPDSTYKSDFCYFLQEVLTNSGKLFNKDELQNFLHNMENELKLSEERR